MKRRALIILTIVYALPDLIPDAAATPSPDPIEQGAQLSGEEMFRFTSLAVQEIEATVREVSRMLQEAERQEDSVAVQCLNRKLPTMQALLEVAEQAKLSCQQARLKGDRGVAEYELRKIAIALNKIRETHAEAVACSTGGTTVVEGRDWKFSGMGGFGDETEPLEYDPPDEDPPPTSQFQ